MENLSGRYSHCYDFLYCLSETINRLYQHCRSRLFPRSNHKNELTLIHNYGNGKIAQVPVTLIIFPHKDNISSDSSLFWYIHAMYLTYVFLFPIIELHRVLLCVGLSTLLSLDWRCRTKFHSDLRKLCKGLSKEMAQCSQTPASLAKDPISFLHGSSLPSVTALFCAFPVYCM